MEKKFYFKTAEFALLCGTTKETLIHYDEIGLLKPHYVAENKYRHYSINQIEEYFTISGLKDLGFSLQSIKAKLQNTSPKSYCELLEQQQEIIEKKIVSLNEAKESISIHLKEIKQYLEFENNNNNNNVIIKKLAQKTIILSPNIVNLESLHEYAHYYSELMNKLKIKTENTYCRYGAIKQKKHVQTKQNDMYQNFYLRTAKGISTNTIPSGTYLITYEKTNFEYIIPAYERLINYANENNITLDSIFYEEIIMYQANTKLKEYIVQIMCQIL